MEQRQIEIEHDEKQLLSLFASQTNRLANPYNSILLEFSLPSLAGNETKIDAPQ